VEGMKCLPVALACFALGPAGCGGGESDPGAPAPSGDETLITYTRSGGFAPMLERLTIEADGDGTARSGFGASGRKVSSFILPPDQLAALRDAIEAAPLDEVETGDYVCADCFGYGIETADAEVNLSDVDFGEDSGANVPPEVEELYDLLAELAERYLPPPPGIGLS